MSCAHRLKPFKKKLKGGHKHQEPVVVRTQATAGHCHGLSVLIVDEDVGQAELLAKSLSARNLKIKFTVVNNWLEAALWLARIRPYLVMLTVRLNPLEKYDGLNFLKTMKTHPDFESVPSIIFSDMSNDELALRGCFFYNLVSFGLPVNFDRLEGFIDAHTQLLHPLSTNKSD